MNRIFSLLERWIKNLDDLGTGFALVGFALMGVGNFLKVALLLNLGLAALGAGIVAWGANAIQSRELTIFQNNLRLSQRVEELLARAWGLVFAGGGLVLFGYGILSALTPRSPILLRVQQFFATPQGLSILLLGGSLVGILFSLTMIFVSDVRAHHSVVRFLLSLPRRFGGFLLFLFCSALAVISVLQIFAPSVWDNLVHTFLRMAGIE